MVNQKRGDLFRLVRAKACKRCGGSLSLERDVYGVFIECIQCGANWTKKDLPTMTDRDKVKRLRVVQANTAKAPGH